MGKPGRGIRYRGSQARRRGVKSAPVRALASRAREQSQGAVERGPSRRGVNLDGGIVGTAGLTLHASVGFAARLPRGSLPTSAPTAAADTAAKEALVVLLSGMRGKKIVVGLRSRGKKHQLRRREHACQRRSFDELLPANVDFS